MCPFLKTRFYSKSFTAYKLRLGINYAQFMGPKIINSTQKLLTVPGDMDKSVRLRTHPTDFRGFSENSTGPAELPQMDVVTPAGPLGKGDNTTKVYAPAPEDNIDDTEGETGNPEGASADPSAVDPNGVTPVSKTMLISVARHVVFNLPHHIAQSCGRWTVGGPLTRTPLTHLQADGSARKATVWTTLVVVPNQCLLLLLGRVALVVLST